MILKQTKKAIQFLLILKQKKLHCVQVLSYVSLCFCVEQGMKNVTNNCDLFSDTEHEV